MTVNVLEVPGLAKEQTFHANTSKGKVMMEVFFNNRTLFIRSTFHRTTL
jgi:hypothetical protein